jgi:hypothetical protein
VNSLTSLTAENMLSLAQAARRLPPGRRGRPVSLSCVLRWVLEGAPGPDGRRVRLEAVRIGGRWLTSAEALGRFAAALTPRLTDESATAPRTPRQRQRAADLAAKRLEEVGI